MKGKVPCPSCHEEKSGNLMVGSLIVSYDIETRAREKDRDAAKEVPGIPQNIPDFAPYAGKNGQEGDKTG